MFIPQRPGKIQVLSESSLRDLAEVVKDFKSREPIPLLQPDIDRPSILFRNTYIAKTRSAGISARSGAILGRGICEIYSSSEGILRSIEREAEVFNILESTLTDEYILVVKDSYGTYLAVVGGSSCTPQNCIMQFTVIGNPTAGSFTFDLRVNGATETLEFDFDEDASGAETELETHSEIDSGDVEVTAGPLPNSTLTIEFKGNLANKNIPLPNIDWSGLQVGTDAFGIAVIASLTQLGIEE